VGLAQLEVSSTTASASMTSEVEFRAIWRCLARVVEHQAHAEVAELSVAVDELRAQSGTALIQHVKTMEERDRHIACVLGGLQAQVHTLESASEEIGQELKCMWQRSCSDDSCSAGLDCRLALAERAIGAAFGLDVAGDAGKALGQAIGTEAKLESLLQGTKSEQLPPPATEDPAAASVPPGLLEIRRRLLAIRSSIASCPLPEPPSPVLSAPGSPWRCAARLAQRGDAMQPADQFAEAADNECSSGGGHALWSEDLVVHDRIEAALAQLRDTVEFHTSDLQDVRGSFRAAEESRSGEIARLARLELRFSQLAEEPLRQAGCSEPRPGHPLVSSTKRMRSKRADKEDRIPLSAEDEKSILMSPAALHRPNSATPCRNDQRPPLNCLWNSMQTAVGSCHNATSTSATHATQ